MKQNGLLERERERREIAQPQIEQKGFEVQFKFF